MKTVVRNLVILVISFALSYITGVYFGRLYSQLFPTVGGVLSVSQRVGNFLIGLPLSYIFFLTVLLTALGGNKKYVWLGILLIPAAAFELYFDLDHIYFPLLLGLAGWSIGIGFARLIKLMS